MKNLSSPPGSYHSYGAHIGRAPKEPSRGIQQISSSESKAESKEMCTFREESGIPCLQH